MFRIFILVFRILRSNVFNNLNDSTLRNFISSPIIRVLVNIIIKHEAKKLGVNFISSNNTLYWNNPSQLIDAAGAYGKNKDDFINELKEIRTKCIKIHNMKNIDSRNVESEVESELCG